MNTEILVVRNLRKTYGGHAAVEDITFSIPRGEIFGLLGPNGAGKTTTISMLTGQLAPTAGRILFDGADVTAMPDAAKSRLGLVPQELALYPTLSARDNLLFWGRLYGLRGRELKDRVSEALELVGLTAQAGQPIETYSGGMKRRVNLAAGLLHRPDLLILDEPTVGVDPQSRNAIFENIEALNRAGLTIIYTTHYMEEAQRLCQRVAIMDHGRIIALDTPANLIHVVDGSVIRLSIAGDQIDEVENRVRDLPSVKGLTRADHHLDIQVRDPQPTLTDILNVTGRLQARITDLQVREASLETVFLNLTGKTLRD